MSVCPGAFKFCETLSLQNKVTIMQMAGCPFLTNEVKIRTVETNKAVIAVFFN